MARQRNDVPTDRYNVSLPRPVSQRVRARAEDQHVSGPAMIATLVTAAVMQGVEDQAAEEARVQASPLFQGVVREKEELAVRLIELRRQVAEQRKGTAAELARTPRWAWPLDSLLTDGGWWEAWLPRLYELLGMDLGYDSRARQAVDDRGYVDLMRLLFPPVGGVTWRAWEYGAAAMAAAQPDAAGAAQVWEPVVRHVARALAALEGTEQPDADPYRALQVLAEISGPWIGVPRKILGEAPAELSELIDDRRRRR